MRSFLEGKSVDRWSHLEDLALALPETSPQFEVLLSTKGWKRIAERRQFLKAQPITKEDITQIGNKE